MTQRVIPHPSVYGSNHGALARNPYEDAMTQPSPKPSNKKHLTDEDRRAVSEYHRLRLLGELQMQLQKLTVGTEEQQKLSRRIDQIYARINNPPSRIKLSSSRTGFLW